VEIVVCAETVADNPNRMSAANTKKLMKIDVRLRKFISTILSSREFLRARKPVRLSRQRMYVNILAQDNNNDIPAVRKQRNLISHLRISLQLMHHESAIYAPS
jgi:hypothetical protein